MSNASAHHEIIFTVSPTDGALIGKIVDRAMKDAKRHGIRLDKISMRMDMLGCHANGTPLRLAEMLAADDFNFLHDVFGIARHLDRETGRLLNHFRPRFAARPIAKAA